MKQFILLYICFIPLTAFTQDYKGGKAIYTKELIVPAKSSKKPWETSERVAKKVDQRMKVIENSFDDLLYVLRFNHDKATFEHQEFLTNEGRSFSKRAILMGEGDGMFYVDRTNNEVIHQREVYGEEFLVKSEHVRWEITSEKKIIDGFSCRKAVANRRMEILDEKLQPKESEVQEIAWFCPDIPFSFGPVGRSGLPGLIVELNLRNVRYSLKDVNFSETESSIEKPTKGRVVSPAEFNDIVAKILFKISGGKLGKG